MSAACADVDVVDARAGRAQAIERLLEPRAHLVVQQVAEVPARDARSAAPLIGIGDERTSAARIAEQRVIDVPRVGDASRASGPT